MALASSLDFLPSHPPLRPLPSPPPPRLLASASANVLRNSTSHKTANLLRAKGLPLIWTDQTFPICSLSSKSLPLFRTPILPLFISLIPPASPPPSSPSSPSPPSPPSPPSSPSAPSTPAFRAFVASRRFSPLFSPKSAPPRLHPRIASNTSSAVRGVVLVAPQSPRPRR